MEPTCHTSQEWPHHQARPAHELGTATPPGTAGPTGAAGPASSAAPAPCHVLGPKHFLPHVHNLDERYLSREHRFDRMDEVVITWINGSTSPANQPPQSSFQEHPERHQRRRFIARLKGGPATPRGPAAPPNCHTDQNRCKEPTLNRLRSKDQERPSREVVDHRASRTSPSGRTYENGPTPSIDLTYL
jgi:hypothetical protein